MHFWAKAALAICGIGMVGTGAVQAQQASVTSDADLSKEAAQADSLYKVMNMVAALPLYEDLHQRQPQSYVWNERLAMCLLGNVSQQPPAERAATNERAQTAARSESWGR